jgi:hypothetical protein
VGSSHATAANRRKALKLTSFETGFACGCVGGVARVVVGFWTRGDFVGHADLGGTDLVTAK